MSPKWFIPIALLAFVVLVGGPSLYLHLTQESPAAAVPVPAHGRTMPGEDRTAPPRAAGRGSRVAAPPFTDGARSGIAVWRDSAAVARHLGERLDEWSVRVRNDLDKSVVSQFARGVAARDAGRAAEALARFDRAIERNADAVAARQARASILLEEGRLEDAAEEYETLLRLAPDNADARYNYAVTLIRLSRFREAAIQLRKAVARAPDHAQAHYNLAALAQGEGRLAEARRSWEAFVRLRPDVGSAWFNLGVTYSDYEMPIEAAASFNAAVEAHPDDTAALLNLAIAYAQAGHLEEARSAVLRADRLEPCNPVIMAYQSTIDEMLAEQDDPARHAVRLIAGAPQDPVEEAEPSP